jgi:hypothetical protein
MYAGATRISCTWPHPTTACAAFSKESRMKFANANKLHRKSVGTWGTRPGVKVLWLEWVLTQTRKGWVSMEDDPACPGSPSERRRCGTRSAPQPENGPGDESCAGIGHTSENLNRDSVHNLFCFYGCAAACLLNRWREISGQNSINSAPIAPSAVTVRAPSTVCPSPRSAAG